jgi:MerR family transcriptional regulator, Zn(II)-responsive regulator of zntA
MKVTEFAKRVGVGPDVVRYYVREGLLAPSRNPANRYKMFGSQHLARMRFIRQVQALGFTLSEIRDLMKRMDAGDCPCEEMREQLRNKIVENQIKLRDMQNRQRFMESAYANWDHPGNDVGELCRMLEEA